MRRGVKRRGDRSHDYSRDREVMYCVNDNEEYILNMMVSL